MPTEVPVLIVGGSLTGLTAALCLAHHGVESLVVERHSSTTVQYKFRGISPRSMEIYKSLGVEAEIRACDVVDKAAAVARMKNLADSKVNWQEIPWAEAGDISPVGPAVCDQDQLEPILKAHAEYMGAEVRFDAELVDFKQDEQGIRARIRSGGSNQIETVRAAYLIAADGTAGTVRQALGINRHGPGVLQHWMNVIFEAGMQTSLEGRAIRSLFVTDIKGTFVPRGNGRWLMAVQYLPAQGQRPEDFTDDHCLELIRRGAGVPDLKAQIVDARQWDAAAARLLRRWPACRPGSRTRARRLRRPKRSSTIIGSSSATAIARAFSTTQTKTLPDKYSRTRTSQPVGPVPALRTWWLNAAENASRRSNSSATTGSCSPGPTAPRGRPQVRALSPALSLFIAIESLRTAICVTLRTVGRRLTGSARRALY
jgi:2-polyprenyl-6-methoxyphenol hydroxylase-like FAD-dependent oxidoreductase